MQKRLGRGNSSKKGNTCCRGYKGQKSRSGYSRKKFFIGGQTPYNILFPKFGFKKKKKKNYITKKIFLNYCTYNKMYPENVKILNNNFVLKKIIFFNFKFSKIIKKIIENNCGFIYE
ncbi:50S ribosomal protein L15 [Candidatus Vidania fulgoroideorum]